MAGSSSKWCYICGFWPTVFWLYLWNTHCLCRNTFIITGEESGCFELRIKHDKWTVLGADRLQEYRRTQRGGLCVHIWDLFFKIQTASREERLRATDRVGKSKLLRLISCWFWSFQWRFVDNSNKKHDHMSLDNQVKQQNIFQPCTVICDCSTDSPLTHNLAAHYVLIDFYNGIPIIYNPVLRMINLWWHINILCIKSF